MISLISIRNIVKVIKKNKVKTVVTTLAKPSEELI